jgi:hypothetical protein
VAKDYRVRWSSQCYNTPQDRILVLNTFEKPLTTCFIPNWEWCKNASPVLLEPRTGTVLKTEPKKIVTLRLVPQAKHAKYVDPNRRLYQCQIKGTSNETQLKQYFRPQFLFVLNYINVLQPHLMSIYATYFSVQSDTYFQTQKGYATTETVCPSSSHTNRNMSSSSKSMKWWHN